MVYGQVLKIPGDFCSYLEPQVDSGTFMQEFRRYLKEVTPVSVPHKTKLPSSQQKPFYYKDLDTCTHVLKKRVEVKPPLTRPYSGPYKVLRKRQ